MIPGMNPKQMGKMMAQMGIKQQQIEANEVIIKTNEVDLVIKNPQVIAVDMKGTRTFQIMGEIEEKEKTNENDVTMIMEQTNVDRATAEKALKNAGNEVAQAIIDLQSD